MMKESKLVEELRKLRQVTETQVKVLRKILKIMQEDHG